jgi:hypothetical protein
VTLQGADADLPAPLDVPAKVFTYSDRIDIDVDFVIGSIYSAMPEHQIARADRPRFERGLRDALATHAQPRHSSTSSRRQCSLAGPAALPNQSVLNLCFRMRSI